MVLHGKEAVCTAKPPAGPRLASSSTYWPQREKQRLNGHLLPLGLLESLRWLDCYTSSHPAHPLDLHLPTQGQKATLEDNTDAPKGNKRPWDEWEESDPGTTCAQEHPGNETEGRAGQYEG